MTKLEQLQAEVKEKAELRAKEIQENMEIARLETKLEVINSDAYAENQMRFEKLARVSSELKRIEDKCEALVDSIVIYDEKNRRNRKFNSIKSYELGLQLSVLSGILSGIQYSHPEHKTHMLSECLNNLDESVVEIAVSALGRSSYFNKLENRIEDEIPYDVAEARRAYAYICNKLDLDIDLSKLNEQVLAKKFESARLKANTQKLEYEKSSMLDDSLIPMGPQ